MAIAFAADDHAIAMVRETIQSCAGEQRIVEYLWPFFEGAVAGDNDGAALIAFADDLVQILGSLGRDRMQAEVIQHQEIDGQQAVRPRGRV